MKMLFHFTKAHKTTIIRSVPGNSHTAPGTEPSEAQRQACSIKSKRWMEGCRFYYYFIFILLLL